MTNGPYSEKVMDHFKNPRNVGEMENPDGTGNVGNPQCGDIMRLFIRVKDDVITDAKFMTFGCLPSQEEVISDDGSWSPISSLSKDNWVLNHEGRRVCIGRTFERRYNGPLLKIVPFVSTTNSFSVTPNHPVLAIKRSQLKRTYIYSKKCSWLQVEEKELLSAKPEYYPAGKLELGDYLVYVPPKETKDDVQFTKELMELLGYYLSEGYMASEKSVVAFAFNKNEKEYIAELKSLLQTLTGKTPKARTRGSVTEVYICSRQWARFFERYAGRLARKKKLASEIMALPFEKQWPMLLKYIAGDGDLYKRRPIDSETYRMKTASKNLAIQLQQILSRGGIFSSIKKQTRRPHCIDGRKINGSDIYELSFKLERKHKFVHTNGSHFLVPIRRIERSRYSGSVYNLSVGPQPNTYLVRGFAVHNCGAAISTSSMVTELVKGKTLKEALVISNKAVAEALGGLPAVKMHCSVLAEDALKSAIIDFLTKAGRMGEFPELAKRAGGEEAHGHSEEPTDT